MNKKGVLSGLLLLIGTVSFAEHLPWTIQSFYQDWNFVALHSTRQEREVLWKAQANRKELSPLDVEILSKMKAIVQAMVPETYSMPNLLAGTEPPVWSELLEPAGQQAVGKAKIVVNVRVMQLPAMGMVKTAQERLDQGSIRGPVMCQYTDTWTLRGDEWRVSRSPFVWVGSNR